MDWVEQFNDVLAELCDWLVDTFPIVFGEEVRLVEEMPEWFQEYMDDERLHGEDLWPPPDYFPEWDEWAAEQLRLDCI